MNLNINVWKNFSFGSLISEIYKAKAFVKDELDEVFNINYGIRYITRTSNNNGCELIARQDQLFESSVEKGNAIVIGDTTATCTYQPDDFICGDHMVVIRADWLNKYLGLFFVTMLNNESFKYSYGRAFLIDRIKKTIIKLPVQHNADGTPIIDSNYKYSEEGYIPDWQCMEDFIKSLNHKPATTKNKAEDSYALNVSEWKEFKLGDLFQIKKGKRLTSDDQSEGRNVYIGAIDSNNGVAANIGQEPIHKGNTISLSYNGSVGEAFYQPEPYWATDDVNALYPRYNKFNQYIGIFVISVLKMEKYKYSYGRKWTLENMKVSVIKLPVQSKPDGTPVIDSHCKYSEEGYMPDWQWMDDYVRRLPYGDRLDDNLAQDGVE